MSESEKKEFKHSGRYYPLGALDPKDNPKLKKQKKEKVMRRIFAAAVIGLIVVGVVGVMAIQREQITRLQKEVDWLKRDVHLLRSQTVALEDIACFAANGKMGHNAYGEKVCDIDEKDISFFDWVGIEKMQQAGWELANINASGTDAKKEGEKFFNLAKKHKIVEVEKIKEVEIFYDSPEWPLELGLWFIRSFKKN